jgi:heme/copper-type cytochrome/quinol oxidase subunit 2
MSQSFLFVLLITKGNTSSNSNDAAIAGASSSDTDVTILVAVIVGGVAFLAFVIAIIVVTRSRDAREDARMTQNKFAVANPTYVPHGQHA